MGGILCNFGVGGLLFTTDLGRRLGISRQQIFNNKFIRKITMGSYRIG